MKTRKVPGVFDLERLVPIITRLYGSLADHTDGWVVVDTTALTAEQAVDAILRSQAGSDVN